MLQLRKCLFLCLCYLDVAGASQISTEPTLSVCSILKDIDYYGGRIVRVEAEIASDVDTWLVDESCDLRLRIGKYDFKPLIKVYFTDSDDVRSALGMITDSEAQSRIWKVLPEVDSAKQMLRIVVDGYLVTRRPIESLVSRKDATALRGFGHLGMAPAQLIVRRMYSMSIVDRKR